MQKQQSNPYTLDKIDIYLQNDYLSELSLRQLGQLRTWAKGLINGRVGGEANIPLYRNEEELHKLITLRREAVKRMGELVDAESIPT